MPKQNKDKIYRVIDANINRLKEGIRVCEDVIRFFVEDSKTWIEFKKIRHSIFSTIKSLDQRYKLLQSRDIVKDIGKKSLAPELKRSNIGEVFFANIQRAKESLRVLEEFSKLVDKRKAVEFKKIRYRLYELERKACKKIKF